MTTLDEALERALEQYDDEGLGDMENGKSAFLASFRADGWTLVPVEATDEMLKSGAAAIRDFYSEKGDYPRTKAMWRAMLESAKENGDE